MSSDWLDPQKLRRVWDPFACDIWEVGAPVTRKEILSFLKRGDLMAPPTECPGENCTCCTRDAHMKRIAWLMTYGWGDSAIEVDVGIPVLAFQPAWAICNGNHRYVAALLRKDRSIRAEVSGQVSEIDRFRAKVTGRSAAP